MDNHNKQITFEDIANWMENNMDCRLCSLVDKCKHNCYNAWVKHLETAKNLK